VNISAEDKKALLKILEAIENIEISLNDLVYESTYQFALAVRM
jgi:hypothetical protein